MPFSDNLVNTIHDKILLSDYIGRSVNLSKKGNDFIGLCPFHNEKTPSFTVSDDDWPKLKKYEKKHKKDTR